MGNFARVSRVRVGGVGRGDIPPGEVVGEMDQVVLWYKAVVFHVEHVLELFGRHLLVNLERKEGTG